MSNDLLSPLSSELLHSICSFIDEPIDLLALALTSKVLNNVVIPLHIESRWIRYGVEPETVGTWKYLASNPLIASEVRYLEILPKMTSHYRAEIVYPSRLVPRASQGPDVQETAKEADNNVVSTVLCDAIPRMTRLEGFKWVSFKAQPPFKLLELLSLLPNLREIEIVNFSYDPEGGFLVDGVADIAASKIWKLSNLSKFSYTESFQERDSEPSSYSEYITQMADMLLHRCPDLQDLQLTLGSDDNGYPFTVEIIQDLFRDAHWPNLKHLNIDAWMLYENRTSSKFFATHPNLQAVRIGECDQEVPGGPDILQMSPVSTLDLDWFPRADELPSTFFRSIRHLNLQVSYGSFGDIDMEFLHEFHSLESFVLRTQEKVPPFGTVAQIVRCVPSVKRFALNFPMNPPGQFSPANCKGSELGDFCAMLTSLPNLTHFSPVYFGLWAPAEHDGLPQDTDARINKALESIVALAPKLVYVHLKDGLFDKERKLPRWVSIQRNEDGKYVGYADANSRRFRKEIDENLWGDIYWGAGKELTPSR